MFLFTQLCAVGLNEKLLCGLMQQVPLESTLDLMEKCNVHKTPKVLLTPWMLFFFHLQN